MFPSYAQNSRTVHWEKGREEWLIDSFYQEDADIRIVLDAGEMKVKELYGASIEMKKTEEDVFIVNYYGPLYAQCTGNRCSPQQYTYKLDKCGRFLGFVAKGTELLNYAPKNKSLHTPIEPMALKRISFYANNAKILRALYDNMAGKDKMSRYVLGNSVGPASTNTLNPLSKGSKLKLGVGSRWGLNPWGTNTVATLFIHLDIVRRALAQIRKPKGCQAWPLFQGQTPIPSQPIQLDKLRIDDRLIERSKQSLKLGFDRLENFYIEELVNQEAINCGGIAVLPYQRADWDKLGVGKVDSQHWLIQPFAKLYSYDSKRINKLIKQVNQVSNKIARAELLKFMAQKEELNKRLKAAKNFKKLYQASWLDGRLTLEETNMLFEAYKQGAYESFNTIYFDKIGEVKQASLKKLDVDAVFQPYEGMSEESIQVERKRLKKSIERVKTEWQEILSVPKAD